LNQAKSIVICGLWSILFTGFINAQEIAWHCGFQGFVDNREYFNSVQTDGTYLGARISPQCVFRLLPAHAITAGINYLYEFGSRWDRHLPRTLLYYRFQNPQSEFCIGAFPREKYLDYPLALLSDTLMYFRPQIEGGLLNHRNDAGNVTIWLDWLSRQTTARREAFCVGENGRMACGHFFLSQFGVLNHYALTRNSPPTENIRDNGATVIQAGCAGADVFKLDSLYFSLGVLASYDRWRHVSGWQTAAGWYTEGGADYRQWRLTVNFYHGQRHQIMSGDRFYRAPTYGRADLIFRALDSPKAKIAVTGSIHYIERRLDFSQKLTVDVLL